MRRCARARGRVPRDEFRNSARALTVSKELPLRRARFIFGLSRGKYVYTCVCVFSGGLADSRKISFREVWLHFHDYKSFGLNIVYQVFYSLFYSFKVL